MKGGDMKKQMSSVQSLMRGAALAVAIFSAGMVSALAEGDVEHPKDQSWSWEGLFGHFDRTDLQHGFQVYMEVCASCHGLDLLAYRNLGDPGGPGFSEAEVKAIAANVIVEGTPDELGDPTERPALPSDRFKNPYPNEQAARGSNGGALPPDLSVIIKARGNGADYVYSILTGYEEAPEDMELREGLYYNPYVSGRSIAMAEQLADGLLEYSDGSEPSAHQMTRDVVTFLAWAAEPKLEARKRTGFQVLLYLIVFAGLMYLVKKKVWQDQH